MSQTEENKEAFNRMPGSFLERLVELLSIPQQGCDVLAPNVGVSSPEWLEFNCRVLPASVAGVDTEVSPLVRVSFDSFDRERSKPVSAQRQSK